MKQASREFKKCCIIQKPKYVFFQTLKNILLACKMKPATSNCQVPDTDLLNPYGLNKPRLKNILLKCICNDDSIK